MKPIIFSEDQVAFMVRLGLFVTPAIFAKQIGETLPRLRRMAKLSSPPSPKVLKHFDLCKQGDVYAWHIR